MIIEYYIDDLFEEKEVILHLECSVENDSFSHEFGTESYPDYLVIEDISYSKEKFTAAERLEIDKWMDDNDETLNRFVENYEPGDDYDGPDPSDFDDDGGDFDYGYHQYDKHYNY